MAFEPIKKGYDPRKEPAGGSWFKMEAGDEKDIIPLVEKDDILSCEAVSMWLDEGNSPFWVYTGPNDPSHALGEDKGYKAYMPLLVEGEVKIWGMSKRVHNSFLDIAETAGGLRGYVLRVKRTGTGLKTAYTITQRNKRKDVSSVEVPDVLAMLGPLTPEGVIEMLENKFGMSFDDVVKKYGKKKEKGGGKGKAADGKVMDFNDDLENLDDLDDDK